MAINDYLNGINQATSGAQGNVTAAAKDLSNLQAGAGSLPSKLKEALNTKLNNNKDIISQQADTMQNYFNAGPQAREKYQNIWNPFTKASLVEQQRTMALRPYDVLSGVLENRMGNVNDIVNAGVSGWQGLTNAASTRLGAAQNNYGNSLANYTTAIGQQQAADTAAEQKRQFNAEMQYKVNHPSGSSDSGFGNIADILALLGGQPDKPVDNFIEPPFSALPGTKKEYPAGSGVIWEAGANGEWI